jgi:hypothetical protein
VYLHTDQVKRARQMGEAFPVAQINRKGNY